MGEDEVQLNSYEIFLITRGQVEINVTVNLSDDALAGHCFVSAHGCTTCCGPAEIY